MSAERAADLADILARGLGEGWAFVCLDGIPIATDRCRSKKEKENVHDAWCLGKYRRRGGNVQVACDPSEHPVWVSPVEFGTIRTTCACTHVIPLLYAAADGSVTLTDTGYTGAEAGIHLPAEGRDFTPDTRPRNGPIAALPAPAEQGTPCSSRAGKPRSTSAFILFESPRQIAAVGLARLHPQRGSR